MKVTIAVRNGEQDVEVALSCLTYAGTGAASALERVALNDLLDRAMTDVHHALNLTERRAENAR